MDMADTTPTPKMLHRIMVTVEMDVTIDPAAVLFPGTGTGEDADLPITGTDELEDQIRQALDGMADELGGGYTFRVTVQDQHEAHSLELPDGW